jgi:glycosyltransferase involved in cell wall biosynthesis
MKKLRIGQISPLNLPVPPKKYGGTERIIFWLCEEFKKKGHEVFLFGTGDSKVSCRLIPIVKKSLWIARPKESTPYYAFEMAEIAKKTKELKLDVLHDHLGPWSLVLYGQVKIPIVHTLHVPFRTKDRIWAYKTLKSKLVSISFSQRKPAPNLNYVANIYNGIDISNFSFSKKPKDYFFWAGELSPRKGILEVIKIAKKAKIKLKIAGRIPPPRQKKDYDFFNKYIKKELNKGKVQYVGELSFKKLPFYYRNAIAFLNPLQWEEPFGLVMIEAMSCGTPVIAFKRGSVQELIKNKVTGFVINPFKKGKQNFDDFIEAIKNVGQIKRENCRKWVKENFTKEKMATEYEKLFFKLLG